MANSYVAFGEEQAKSGAGKGKVLLALFIGFGLGVAACSFGGAGQQVLQEEPVTAAAMNLPFTPRKAAAQPQLRSTMAAPAWRLARSPTMGNQGLRNVRVFDGEGETKTLSPKVTQIMDLVKELTLMQAADLVKELEDTFGVVANSGGGMMMMAPGMAPAAGGGGAPAAEAQTTFNVVLDSVDESKRVAALKVVRGITGLGLKEVKDFMSALPKPVKEGATKEEAEDIVKQLTDAGGKATIK
jgi:large subunit ribosomal protein L7/L12